MKMLTLVGADHLRNVDIRFPLLERNACKRSDDRVIARKCKDERLCLITADLGFAQILEYPPNEYSGIIILRHPSPTLAGMNLLVRQIAAALKTRSPLRHLWIVEPGRIRIHSTSADTDS